MTRPTPPAIVVMAHNRPGELQRLLASASAAEIAHGTTLVVSIDGGGDRHAEVCSVADKVVWTRGDTAIIENEHLGLVDHFHRCGDLTTEHGSIVLLEDDLLVGPAFQRWTIAALEHAASDHRIAGVSLAAPFFDGYRHLPFEPIVDGSDAIFAQVPWYDGMAWTDTMWRSYRTADIDPATPIHQSFATLDDDEWFPDAVRYLVGTNRYYLLPRHAHATNSGAPGTHFEQHTNYFQVPLSMQGPAQWRIGSLDDALAVYDDYLEPDPRVVKHLVPELAVHDFAVDLLGVRDLRTVTAAQVITTRRVEQSTRSWGVSLHPLIANLVNDVPGDAIHLAEVGAVLTDSSSDTHARQTLTAHANRGREPSGRDALRHLFASLRRRFTHGG